MYTVGVAISVITDSVTTVPGKRTAGGLANFLLATQVSGSSSDTMYTGFGLEKKNKHLTFPAI